MKWATENKIVTGYEDGTFGPEKSITREQMCVMLVRYAKYKSIDIKKNNDIEFFADNSKISSWATEAVYTCQMAGIVNGTGGGKFEPQKTATRAQVAKILSVFHKDYIV